MNALQELEQKIKNCPIGRLPEVVAALEGKGEYVPAKRRGNLAKGVVALESEAFARAIPKTHAELIELETAMLRNALEESGGNQSAAARAVGLDRKTFIRRARKLKVAR